MIEFITKSIPLTASIAIGLFLLKQAFDFISKIRADRSKIRALFFIFQRELEINYFCLENLFTLVRTIKDATEEYPKAQMRLLITPDGSEHFRIKYPYGKNECGQSIKPFSFEAYAKYAVNLAELKPKVYTAIELAYREFYALEQDRRTISAFLSNKEPVHDHSATRTFIFHLADQEDKYKAAVHKAYRLLAGPTIEIRPRLW